MECSYCGKEIKNSKPVTDTVTFHSVTVIRYYHYHCAYTRVWYKMGFTLDKTEYRAVEKTVELAT